MSSNNDVREVTLAELAELMQAAEARVLRLVEKHGLPSRRKNGKWHFRLDEVSAWMTQQSMACTIRERRRRSYEANHQTQRA
jgi:excisionase family DNA binding protein